MRRGLVIGALAGAATLGGVAAPAGAAQPTCTLPKGVYTANAQFQYATYLYTGEGGDSLAQLSGSLAHPSDRPRMEAALANVSRGNASRTLTWSGAAGRYGADITLAVAGEPPSCS